MSEETGIEPLLAALDASARRLEQLRGLPEGRWRRRPPDGGWSALEALAHLRAANDIFSPRLTQVLVRDNPPLIAFDERRWQEVAGYSLLAPSRLAASFVAQRDELLHALRRLPPEAWQRGGIHETAGAQTLRDIAATMAGHEAEHVDQIDGLLAGPA